jgi:hypothetical protein
MGLTGDTNMQAYHYYGSSAYGWACADTLAEVLKQVASYAGDTLIKRAVKNNGGLLVVTCRVPAPIDAEYKISEYLPVGMGITDVNEYRICSIKGYSLPVEKEPPPAKTLAELEAENPDGFRNPEPKGDGIDHSWCDGVCDE